jgi:DNA-binding GntR family transcriptional regulator
MDSFSVTPPVHSQLWESVLSRLRLAIVTGALAPGTHLVETELAARLAVSRGPVREALTRLEHEGLVVNYPYRGRFVAEITEEDIREVYDLRKLIESRAIEFLGHVIDDAGLARLREIRQQMIEALSDGRNEEFADLDVEFHRQIMTMSRRERLLKIWNTLASVTHAFIVINARNDPDAIRTVSDGHEGILEALARHDTATACEVLKAHLNDAETTLLGTKAHLQQDRSEHPASG